jgi:hypothetical protein
MPHVIAEVIIENGKLKYVDRKLPSGKIRAHIIYDAVHEKQGDILKGQAMKIVKDTSGIYRGIDVERECRLLRDEWDRDGEK